MKKSFDLTKIRNNKSQYLDYLVFFILFSKYIISVFNLTLRYFFGNLYKIDTLLMYAFLGMIILLSIKEILQNMRGAQLIFVSFVIISLAISYFSITDNSLNNEVAKKIILECISVFIVISSISNYEKLWHYMKFGSYLAIASIAYLMFLLKHDSFIVIEGSSQSNAYALLLPCSILLISLFEKFDIKGFIVLSIGFFMLLLYGARGPVICMIVLVFLLVIRQLAQNTSAKRNAYFSLSIVLFSSFVLLFDKIAYYLYSIFSKYNMPTRILVRLINNSFFQDYARESLIEEALKSIKQNFIFGVGIINDRKILNDKVLFEQTAIGSYPHNIVLEILMQFGVFVGTIMITAMALIIYKTYKLVRNSKIHVNMFLTFLTIGLLPLFFSGSYISDPSFYILIGFCFSVLNKQCLEILA